MALKWMILHLSWKSILCEMLTLTLTYHTVYLVKDVWFFPAFNFHQFFPLRHSTKQHLSFPGNFVILENSIFFDSKRIVLFLTFDTLAISQKTLFNGSIVIFGKFIFFRDPKSTQVSNSEFRKLEILIQSAKDIVLLGLLTISVVSLSQNFLYEIGIHSFCKIKL